MLIRQHLQVSLPPLLLSTLTLLSACGLTSGEPCGQEKPCFAPLKRPVSGQILVYNNTAEPQTIDPGLATGTPDGRIIDELFEGLTEYHPKTLEPLPGVAEKYQLSPDGRDYIFSLRKNAKWSNGDPVRAQDFVYSWERVLNPVTAAQYSYILFPIKNAEKYLSEAVRVVQSPVTATNEAPEGPLSLEAGLVVDVLESNVARISGDGVKLASSAGAEQSGADLTKDQLVLIRRGQSLTKPGGKPDEKEDWFEVDAYTIDLESAEEVKKLSTATALHGWLKKEQVAPFLPSSNRRVLAEQELLRKKPQGESVKLIEDRTDAVIPAGDEVRILLVEGAHTKVYWPAKSRYGYIKSTNLLNPWGEVYRFKVAPQQEGEAKAEPQPEPCPPAPVSLPADSQPTSGPVTAPATQSGPCSLPTVKKPEATKSGWVFAKDLLMEPKVLGFKAIDDNTLEVRLNSSTPYFLSLLAHYTFRPIHPATFEEWGLAWTDPEHIVGNGPFKLEVHVLRDRYEMVRSDTYWDRENVTLEKIVALAMEDQNTTLMMYKAGYTDLVSANDMPTTYVPILYDYNTLEPKMADFDVTPSLGTYFYRLNVKKKPFDDLRIRKALAMGIDKTKLPKVTQVPYQPAYSIVPGGIHGYTPEKGVGFDPVEGKRLIKEVYPNGDMPTIAILFNTSELHKTVAEFIQAQWKDNLGIEVVLENKEWKTYLDSVQHLNYQAARAGWIGDYLDPMTFLDMWVTDGGNNNTNWSNKDYDQMIKDAQNETDLEKRRQILLKMDKMINEELPVIPLYTYVWYALTKPYVKNFYSNVQDKHPLKWVCIETQITGESKTPVCTEVEKRLEDEKGFQH